MAQLRMNVRVQVVGADGVQQHREIAVVERSVSRRLRPLLGGRQGDTAPPAGGANTVSDGSSWPAGSECHDCNHVRGTRDYLCLRKGVKIGRRKHRDPVEGQGNAGYWSEAELGSDCHFAKQPAGGNHLKTIAMLATTTRQRGVFSGVSFAWARWNRKAFA